jgi:maleate cis-trans isomerase
VATVTSIKIGFMSPVTASRSHFASFRRIIPDDVEMDFQELGIVRNALTDLKDRGDAILTRTASFVGERGWDAVIVPGAPVELQNPGLRQRLECTLAVPFTTALAACVESLTAVGARRVLFLTPFDRAMNALLEVRLREAGVEAICPDLGFSREDDAADIGADEIVALTLRAREAAGDVDAVYFQGAVLDVVPVIDRLESELALPVVASNPAMLWSMLSKLDRRYDLEGPGQLLASWPPLPG